ncbi:MAG: HAD family hydrolase [Butyrivibrio sp.]|nr:HAD family hydrolase [Acetatifactor muris]MCM1560309.1 HAD family hydrolase [Butyrivibrio sp.]
MYTNYIFDLYGTLADIRTNESKASLWKYMAQYMTFQGAPYSAPELRRRYRSLIDALRLEQWEKSSKTFPEVTPEEIEVNLSHVFSRLYSEKGITPSPRMIADWALMYRTVSLDYVRLYDGAEALLRKLRRLGKKVWLLSNAQRLFTEPELRSLRIYDLFDDVLISSDIGFMKPSGQFYAALLSRHRLDPKTSVMIGNDWQADAWGAYNNGLACMYIHTAQSPEPAGALPPGCIRLKAISDVLSI